ncbi:Peptide transport system permease protein sapB [Kluyvera cryocrescens]|uniref:Peptide transport system permease protein sapB n=1 Tax=Kluyvera cryocrescens TaxID=580 RepID=A0A485A555_KLUCR|nr:Peptide transport system permease protein sapB [Kluyvera cryocrescens]
MPMTKPSRFWHANCPSCRWRLRCVLQAYRYDMKGLVLSPFGNASFAGVSREKRREGAETMIIFTLRRLLLLLVTLFFLTVVGFCLSYFTPHAPLQGASLWNAWAFWFDSVMHWDFGVSSINGQPISEQLRQVFPATMELCIMAFGFALLVGIPVGMLAGITRNKWQDKVISFFALLGFSIPVFWLALLLTLFFLVNARLVAGFRSLRPAV